MVLRNTRVLFTPAFPPLHSVWTLALWWSYPSAVWTASSFSMWTLKVQFTFSQGPPDPLNSFRFINRAHWPVVFWKMKGFYKHFKQQGLQLFPCIIAVQYFLKLTLTDSDVSFITLQQMHSRFTEYLSFVYSHVVAISASSSSEPKTKASALWK